MGVLFLTSSVAPDFEQMAIDYAGRQFGIMLTMGLPTFNDSEGTNGSLPVDTFDPGDTYDMDQWIAAVVSSGAQYAILVAKHHDGFCLWPSATTTYDIAATTWYSENGSPDIVGEFVTKAKAAGLFPVLYLSIKDANTDMGDQAAFRALTEGQLTELAVYGVTAIWIDGAEWSFPTPTYPTTAYPWNSAAERSAFIHSLRCLQVNNSHTGTLDHSDVIVLENEGLPSGGNTTPSEAITSISTDGWFWKSTGNAPITAASVLSNIATASARTCAFCLSVPPGDDGLIDSNFLAVLDDIGEGLA